MGLPPPSEHPEGGGQSVTPTCATGVIEQRSSNASKSSTPSTSEALRDVTPLSPLEQFASSPQFLNFTLFIIVLNGIWIGADVEWNHPSLKVGLEPGATVLENLFCSYFTFEIVLRICAFGRGNLNGSFLFDFVLVVFMVLETWVMAIMEAATGASGSNIFAKFSVLRLLRLTRLMRLATSLPELLTLVRGMLNAARAVGVVLLFMLLLMYVFAIVFTAQIGDPNAEEHSLEPYWVRDEDPTAVELFGTMIDSMMSLFTRGMLGDNLAETLQAIKDRGDTYSCSGEGDEEVCGRTGGELWLMWVFIGFMILSASCLLNMLVGILCEVITETAQSEAETNQVDLLHRHIALAFLAIDESGDDLITKTEWTQMRQDEKVRHSFKQIGVEENFMESSLDQIEEHMFGRIKKSQIPSDKVWFGNTVGADSCTLKGIPIEEFVTEILCIRPDSSASYLDIAALQARLERDEAIFNAEITRIENMLTAKRGRKEDTPNTGISGAPDAWLQRLPTDILFAELKYRASLQANSSAPALDVD